MAGALALASGCAAAGAGPSQSVGVPATASSTPSSAAPSAPAASAPAASGGGDWQPGRYEIGLDLSSVIDLLPDGTAYLTEQPFVTSRDTYKVTGDTVTFAGESCGGVTGTYRWSSHDRRLDLVAVADPCADRAKLLGLRLDLLKEQLPYVAVRSSKVLDQPDYNFSTAGSDGHFYTTDGYTGFYEYDADGTLLRAWPNDLTYTTGITVTGDGTIYVANFDDATIRVFKAGKPVRRWPVDHGTIGPVGLAHDAGGNIYVALHRQHDHYVEKYSPNGKLLGAWAGGAPSYGVVSSVPGPSGISVTPGGTSYLTDPGNNRILKFRPDGTFDASLEGDGTHRLFGPGFVAADRQGHVFTMSFRTLWEFDDTGKVVGRWFSPYESTVAVDKDDNLWIIDHRINAVELPGS